MSGWGILENLFSDIIFLILAILVSWLWVILSHRRQLQKFFGVTKTKRLVIYLSLINVTMFGSTGIDKRKFSYTGKAVDYGEMQIANQIRNLFSFIVPKLTEASKTIGKLLLSDIDVNLDISPSDQSKLETQAPFVSLGSPAYNTASSYIETIEKGIVKFQIGFEKKTELKDIASPTSLGSVSSFLDDKQHYIISPGLPVIPSGIVSSAYDLHLASGTASAFDQRFTPENAPAIQRNSPETDETKTSAIIVKGISPILDTTYGFIERIKEPISERVLFYVAGLSELGTTGAANYLATQWNKLYKKYKTKPFLIMLSFNTSDFSKWSIIFENELPN